MVDVPEGQGLVVVPGAGTLMTATRTDRLDHLGSTLDDLRTEVRGFLDHELTTGGFVPDTDSWMTGFDAGFSARVAERGWLGMTVPTEYGGHGRSPLERFVVSEEMLAHGAPVAAHWIADRQMAPSISRTARTNRSGDTSPESPRGPSSSRSA